MEFSIAVAGCKENFVLLLGRRWKFQFNLIAEIVSKDKVQNF